MLSKSNLYNHYTQVEAPLLEALAVTDAHTQQWQTHTHDASGQCTRTAVADALTHQDQAHTGSDCGEGPGGGSKSGAVFEGGGPVSPAALGVVLSPDRLAGGVCNLLAGGLLALLL